MLNQTEITTTTTTNNLFNNLLNSNSILIYYVWKKITRHDLIPNLIYENINKTEKNSITKAFIELIICKKKHNYLVFKKKTN